MKQKHLEIPPETLINILIVGRKQDVGGGGREGGEEGVIKVISTAWGEWGVGGVDEICVVGDAREGVDSSRLQSTRSPLISNQLQRAPPYSLIHRTDLM